MEIKEMNKADFAALVKSCGKENRQLVFENSHWYEQIVADEVAYRHKLLVVKALSREALAKTTPNGILPSYIRVNGAVVALISQSKTTLYYHLPVSTKQQMNQARSIVHGYAKSLLAG